MTDRPRSNSFHYTVEAVAGPLPRARWEVCPVRPTASAWAPGRVVFVRRDGRVGRFVTRTRDFTEAELDRAVRGLGQLYLDVSGKASLDDFARDLVRLRRSPVCDGCPAFARCAGMFEPAPDDVFTRDDALVREALGALRGGVVDVGCGEGPYEDILAPAAETGLIRYVGLDPDPARIEALRARWPWADLRVASAEDLGEASAEGLAGLRADHVLVLRSWNHLRNPVRAVETFARMLRPGGSLLVVDNVAFGLVRGRAHARRAESGPAVFEHHRNDGAGEAHDAIALAAPGLRLVERHEVSASTSNQWLLRYQKP